jgi:inhibitor of KinA
MRTPSVSGARFVRSSDQSLLIYFDPPRESWATDRAPDRARDPGEGRTPLVAANESVRRLLQLLESQPIAGVRNLHPAYCSLLVKFDALKWRHEELEGKLREYLEQSQEVRLPEPRLVEIPVCYGEELGPDLQDVATTHGITPDQVIQLHSSTTYRVYFLGFLPGFAYLGELPEMLVMPRHSTPRRKVPAGSVGIAGNQTGVYPCETPGGWRLLGRTPLAMLSAGIAGASPGTPLRPDQEGLSLLTIGDRVRFRAISREQFAIRQSDARQKQ